MAVNDQWITNNATNMDRLTYTIAGLLIGLFLFVGIPFSIWKIWGLLKPSSKGTDRAVVVLLFFALAAFIIAMNGHSTPHYQDIDPLSEPCYSPIAYAHSGLLIGLHLMALFSMLALYFRGYALPPLQIAIYLIFIAVGIAINAQFLYQISDHDTSRIYGLGSTHYAGLYLAFYPALLILASIGIIVRMVKNKARLNREVQYGNKWLNAINRQLVRINNLPLTAVLLSIPFLFLLVLILILFGQDVESFPKVYTETATWKLSQCLHPPTVDDRHGHYLCTVAAMGSPQLVRPIGIGRRNGQPILVNRQLQIANAFEFMVEQVSPAAHRVIRAAYDRYGLNLSKKINTERLSNLTYVLMKPLEWFFLLVLYAYYSRPEEVIGRQYRPKNQAHSKNK